MSGDAARIARLEQQIALQDGRIADLEKDLGIEGAINKLGTQIVTALGGSNRTYVNGEEEIIGELRSSLARPKFDALEKNLGRVATAKSAPVPKPTSRIPPRTTS